MLLIALAMIHAADSPWSEQVARVLMIDELTAHLRRGQEHVVEGLARAEELAWLRPLVRMLRHWDGVGVRSAAVLEAVRNLRAALSPDVPWTQHPLLATLPAALDSLELPQAKPGSGSAMRGPAGALASSPWATRRSYNVDRGPPAWVIEPGSGVGSLRMGMPIADAVRAIDELGLGPAEQVQKGSAMLYMSRTRTIRLVPAPATPETLCAVEFILLRSLAPEQRPQPELFGHKLLGMPLDDARKLLFSLDARAEKRAHLIEAPTLGVRVWSGGEPPDYAVDSVTVTFPSGRGDSS
jgi:hypothetical protein